MKTTMSKAEIAKMFDCTPRWIEKLVQAGMPKAAQGKFDVLKSGGGMFATCKRLSSIAPGRGKWRLPSLVIGFV